MARYRKSSPGLTSLMNVAGLWQDYGEQVRGEEEGKRQFGIMEGRRQRSANVREQSAMVKIEQAERLRTLKVWDRLLALHEKATDGSIEQEHYGKLLEGLYGAVSPRNKKMLEPYLKYSPLAPREKKRQFFDAKNPKIPRPMRNENETDQDYNNRLAPWAAKTYRRDWEKRRYLFGTAAVGPVQEMIPYGEDENDNTVFLRMPKGEPASFETRTSAEFTVIEESGGHFGKKIAKGSLRNNKGIEKGPTTIILNGPNKEAHTQTYNWFTGKKKIEKVVIGPRDLVREDLRMAVPKPPKGYADFQVRLSGGKKPDIYDVGVGDIGSRIYDTAFTFRQNQLESKAKISMRILDNEFKAKLSTFWPGHTIRYKFDKGTATEDKPFGDNPLVEVVPGMPMYARKPGTKDKWMKIIWDSNSAAIWAIDPASDRYEPLMTRKEHIEVHGVDLMTVGEYRTRFLSSISSWAIEYKGE